MWGVISRVARLPITTKRLLPVMSATARMTWLELFAGHGASSRTLAMTLSGT